LHIAPYSYDWIDNYCRKSPPRLIRGADQVKVGQRWFLKIFELVEFEPGRQLTLHIGRARWFWGPDVGATYLLVPYDLNSCRLIVNVVTYAKPGIIGALRRELYPWGELVMMQKQLLTFKRLSEKHFRSRAEGARVAGATTSSAVAQDNGTLVVSPSSLRPAKG